MNHLVVAPILLPLFTALILLIGARLGGNFLRWWSLISTSILVIIVSALLVQSRSGVITLYALGNWMPPFGIVLIVDRLAAFMLMMTAVLAFFSVLYAMSSSESKDDSLHPLIHFLLMGLNGAFLTGDLFNLFVFFEVLLLASYSLLLYGGGQERTQSGLHYVILNLIGSALFLIGVAMLYGVTGTLNMADMGQKITLLDPDSRQLAKAGGFLLFVVFGLKAAIVPLYFWLPNTYAAAIGPVAALFAVMTKLGVYVILRVYSLTFGMGAEGYADFLLPWIWPLALLTLTVGVIGTLAAKALSLQIAYLVVVSVGTLLLGIAMNNREALSAALYYMLQSTWICGALFLLSEMMSRQRGIFFDRIVSGPSMKHNTLFGVLFFLVAITVVGMPPTSGFIGKLHLLQSAHTEMQALWVWPALLIASIMTITALSRSGSTLFWRTNEAAVEAPSVAMGQIMAVVGLIIVCSMLSVMGNTVIAFTNGIADQLLQPERYLQSQFMLQMIER